MLSDISTKRWFMGKGKPVQEIVIVDETHVQNVTLQILQVKFQDGTSDLYANVTDETRIGELLAAGFEGYIGNDTFEFSRTALFPASLPLSQARPLAAEQSNSAFCLQGQFFFKLFRRLQAGPHPEQETMLHLNKSSFDKVPQLYGYVNYKDRNGNSYAIGILESHVPDAQNAWDIFTSCDDIEFLKKCAFELGKTTAQMHEALRDLPGCRIQAEEVPFEKLIGLLKANGHTDLVPRIESLEKAHCCESTHATPNMLQAQRIHGDYHLGQVLWNGKNFTILDFEGEPTRSLEYRRRLRSPATDIAGMLRSFAYASAVQNAQDMSFEQITANAFLQGYSEVTGINSAALKEIAQPFILGKAIYEACYELEYRPDWFWIPEQALKNEL